MAGSMTLFPVCALKFFGFISYFVWNFVYRGEILCENGNGKVVFGVLWIFLSLGVIINLQLISQPPSSCAHKKITTYILCSLFGDVTYLILNIVLPLYFSEIFYGKCPEKSAGTLYFVFACIGVCTLLLEFVGMSFVLKYDIVENMEQNDTLHTWQQTKSESELVSVDTDDTLTRFDLFTFFIFF